MKLRDRLVKMGACQLAVDWVGDRDLKTAWAECERADWMLWFAARTKCPRKPTILSACDCARRVLRFVPAGEDRPRLAIEAAEKAAKYPTKKNKAAARDAAWAAARDAWAARASRAAWAARAAARASRAAGDAAWASGAARVAELKIMADIVRKRIKVSDLRSK